jgi:hypothetical protein
MYKLTPQKIKSIQDSNLGLGTIKYLPKWNEIPADFKQGNKYTQFCEALFFGKRPEKGDIKCGKEFEELWREKKVIPFLLAHLRSYEPKHEHKIAGVGYMLSQTCTLILDSEKTKN